MSRAISVTQDGEVVSFDRDVFKADLRLAGFAIVPLDPPNEIIEALYGPYMSHVSHKTRCESWRNAIAAYEKECGDG